MNGAVVVAVVAAVGNLLQGWDNSTIAGAVMYIKREFHLEAQPTLEGLIVSTSLIGATIITTFSGPVSDLLGRRPILILSSLFFFLSGSVSLWAPNVYVLLLARLLNGFGIGLAVTLVPVYISETAPPEIRGQLNTLPQFMGSGGMFFSYCMVFAMSLSHSPSWRLMLGVISIPALVNLLLLVFFLPESPRWLVSKGRMLDARRVLQLLRSKDDVSGELALLIEGLGVGRDTRIEEYLIALNSEPNPSDQHVKLYGPDEGGASLIAKQVTGQSTLNLTSRQGSMINQLKDPLVTLFGSVHEALPSRASSCLFPVIDGSQFDDETPQEALEDNLQAPLLDDPQGEDDVFEIGGGWQLAYKWEEKTNEDGKKEGEFQRVYLHEEAEPVPGEFVQAAALVSQPVLNSRLIMSQHQDQDIVVPPMTDLLEPGVKRALIVGVGLQILQQASGINGVLYYTPEILSKAGVSMLLADLGLTSESASLLISVVTTLTMLPCIVVSMRLMDVAGRRALMLSTIPILVAALVALVSTSVFPVSAVMQAVVSTGSVMVYTCCFVMGFGAIPNILCAEIFPTRVRGICITICALSYWVGNIIVTYTMPLLLHSIGLAGVFSVYAVACAFSWVFVFLKVPETKGMPLEVISEFFSVGASALGKGNVVN